jgi:hypothetical protein
MNLNQHIHTYTHTYIHAEEELFGADDDGLDKMVEEITNRNTAETFGIKSPMPYAKIQRKPSFLRRNNSVRMAPRGMRDNATVAPLTIGNVHRHACSQDSIDASLHNLSQSRDSVDKGFKKGFSFPSHGNSKGFPRWDSSHRGVSQLEQRVSRSRNGSMSLGDRLRTPARVAEESPSDMSPCDLALDKARNAPASVVESMCSHDVEISPKNWDEGARTGHGDSGPQTLRPVEPRPVSVCTPSANAYDALLSNSLSPYSFSKQQQTSLSLQALENLSALKLREVPLLGHTNGCLPSMDATLPLPSPLLLPRAPRKNSTTSFSGQVVSIGNVQADFVLNGKECGHWHGEEEDKNANTHTQASSLPALHNNLAGQDAITAHVEISSDTHRPAGNADGGILNSEAATQGSESSAGVGTLEQESHTKRIQRTRSHSVPSIPFTPTPLKFMQLSRSGSQRSETSFRGPLKSALRTPHTPPISANASFLADRLEDPAPAGRLASGGLRLTNEARTTELQALRDILDTVHSLSQAQDASSALNR